MSQHMPPNQGQPDENTGAPQDQQSYGYTGANPYYGQQSNAQQAPDLDAGAPLLKSSDVQKLNRKALLFLAGIVVLLVFAAVWMFTRATSSEDDKPKVEEEVVNIPELPKAASDVAPPLPPEQVSDLPPVPLAPEMPPPQQNDAPQMVVEDTGPRGPTLMERRMMNSADGAGAGGMTPGQAATAGMTPPDEYAKQMMAMVPNANGQMPQPGGQREAAAVASAKPIYNPDTLLVRGTYIRCVMETRIITDVPGFTSCIVTEPTYSINGRRLLLPKGSKISGRYQNDNINGPRVSVIWDRITTPTGIDVNMASPGVDNLGGAGHPGDYNAHWGSRIASALMISLIADAFKYAAAENGPPTNTVTGGIGGGGVVVQSPYESVTARSVERLANQALDKSVNRPPTVTINQGTVVNVYVAKDVDFSSIIR
ncbi:TrbI/VirB10 family protein [Lysobacter sp. cf310]|uniref:TrbI/VirB10 family protein n=1 Tax=Lysobacter sp. cf310 TaxID=1761790 RepID=UPI0008E3CD46|nr:TrbI/VirB10 family protein [Lysobacter sp. cf310]SFK97402.1 type IV secretion system protein VirB10 [Lysobacter sp. cf310]